MGLLMLMGGAFLLYLGAEWLVGGSSNLALSLRVPSLVVGLTVVAYGTSAPEAVVGIQAAWDGHGGIAVGNVVGSNIANLGLILGLSSLLLPAKVPAGLFRRELPVMLGAALALILVLADGHVRRWEGWALLAGALAYTSAALRGARAEAAGALADAGLAAAAAEQAGAPAGGGRWRQGLVAVAGLAMLVLGGGLFVQGASALARAWGVSERLVGLTIVAVGTSLPELLTSLVAARQGHSDIGVGNVVGSNIFNVLFCLGAAGALRPLSVDPRGLRVDLLVMLGLTLAAARFLRTARRVARWEAACLLGAYVAYLAWLGARGR